MQRMMDYRGRILPVGALNGNKESNFLAFSKTDFFLLFLRLKLKTESQQNISNRIQTISFHNK